MNKLNKILLSEIKSKPQIKDLQDNFIEERIEKYFLTNGDIRKKLEKEFEIKQFKIVKSRYFKEVLKRIRKEIGTLYGSFLTQDFTKKEKLLDKDVNYKELLKLHKSTRERIDYYEDIYNSIFEWYVPKKIADLACGLNPLSYELIKKELLNGPKYFASDLNPNDMDYLNSYFKKNKIDGIAKSYDITNLKIIDDKDFKDCDLVFLFKALDSFEFIKKDISKDLIKKIQAKKIVVSFPTKSLVSRKEFKIEKRNWFINFIEKENYEYEKFEVEGELFFLITKG